MAQVRCVKVMMLVMATGVVKRELAAVERQLAVAERRLAVVGVVAADQVVAAAVGLQQLQAATLRLKTGQHACAIGLWDETPKGNGHQKSHQLNALSRGQSKR